MARTAIVAGSSGLIGRSLINLILNDDNYNRVISVGRRNIAVSHPKLSQVTLDFERLEDKKEALYGDVFFYCIGTTKKKTPDAVQYERIEFFYPCQTAAAASNNNISQFHFVSSLGADSKSTNTYLKLKGRAEEAIQQLKFKSVHCYRPSLLKGDRKEFRLLEKLLIGVMSILNPLLIGKLKRYKSIDADIVAKTMLNQSLQDITGIQVYESDQIRELA
jgi:uncharacterized protein YbjT (DUF2867 family)